MNKYYNIETPYSSYNVVIIRRKDRDEIYLGGKTFYCLEVVYDILSINKDAECFINNKTMY